MKRLLVIIESVSKLVWDIADTPVFDSLPYSFDYAYSASNWTLPSVSSMVSGVYPDVHGAKVSSDVYGYDGADLFYERQMLGDKTVFISDIPYSMSIGRGVEVRRIFHKAKYTGCDNLLESLNKHSRGENVTAAIHLSDTHSPYGHPKEEPWKVIESQSRAARKMYPNLLIPEDEDTARKIMDAFSDVMRWQKEELEKLDGKFEGFADEWNMVVLSDHGENWDPRYNFGHGFSYTLKEDAIHTPLMTNIKPRGKTTEITSSKNVYNILTGRELEQGQAESHFYGYEQRNNPCVSDDNRVLIDDRGWHYARRYDDMTQGSTTSEGYDGRQLIEYMVMKAK